MWYLCNLSNQYKNYELIYKEKKMKQIENISENKNCNAIDIGNLEDKNSFSEQKRCIRTWIILIGMFVIPFAVLAQQEVRDNKGNLQYVIEKDGTIRLPNGRVKGKVTDNKVEIKDAKGKTILRNDNGRVVDTKGKTQYRVTPSAIVDDKGRLVAGKDSTTIYDKNGKAIYRVK